MKNLANMKNRPMILIGRGCYSCHPLHPLLRVPSVSSTLAQISQLHTSTIITKDYSHKKPYTSFVKDEFSNFKYWEHNSLDSSSHDIKHQLTDVTESVSESSNKCTDNDMTNTNHSDKFWNDFSRDDGRVETILSNTKSDGMVGKGQGQGKLSHVNIKGEAQMVDVSSKTISIREAIARAEVYLGSEAFTLVRENKMKKGDVLGVARIAGILAAKRTSELIPLCHPIPLDHVEVSFDMQEKFEEKELFRIIIQAKAITSGRTGVEMEALTAASVAALTIYDMCKAVSHDITISNVCLMYKAGGKRDFCRELQ